MQQKAISIKFGAKGGHYRSDGFVFLSVISGACADNLTDAADRLLRECSFNIGRRGMGRNLYLEREKTEPGSLGRFAHLITISSAVSGPIVTKLVMEVVAGTVQHLVKSELRNSKRLPWKCKVSVYDGARQPRTFW